MTEHSFLQILGEIDPRLIREAMPEEVSAAQPVPESAAQKTRRNAARRMRIVRWGGIAACGVLCVGIGAWVLLQPGMKAEKSDSAAAYADVEMAAEAPEAYLYAADAADDVPAETAAASAAVTTAASAADADPVRIVNEILAGSGARCISVTEDGGICTAVIAGEINDALLRSAADALRGMNPGAAVRMISPDGQEIGEVR